MKKIKTKFGFVDPKAIMAVVVSLIIVAVGVFAVFYTLTASETVGIGYDDSPDIRQNISGLSNPITFSGLYANTEGFNSITLIYDDGSTRTVGAGEYTWSSTNPRYISLTLTS